MVSGFWFWFWIKTDNTAYQALVLVWLWCGNISFYFVKLLFSIHASHKTKPALSALITTPQQYA